MTTYSQPTSLPPLDTDHRRLLSSIESNDSPLTDQESSDEAIPDPAQEDVIGVSISGAQSLLKSPQTPAIEKQRVLERSLDYFDQQTKPDTIPEAADNDDSSPNHSPVVSPWQAHPSADQKSSISGAFNDARNSTKRRSRSSSNMFGSLIKMLPDLPSLPNLKSITNVGGTDMATRQSSNESSKTSASSGDGGGRAIETLPTRSKPFYSYIGGVDGPADKQPGPIPQSDGVRDMFNAAIRRTDSSRTTRSKRHSDPAVAPSATLAHESSHGLDGSAASMLEPNSPGTTAQMRRNSESSLYLSRRVTSASTYDDTSLFANVTDMANSRFKAITDSLQNSTIRFPRFMNALQTANQSKNVSTETTRNTVINARSSKNEHIHQYTSIHDIKKSKKLIELETNPHRAHPLFFEALDELEGDLVIMGGYRGSILRDAKSHRQLWAPVKVGLGLRNVDLEVGLYREDEEKAHEKIIASGILANIGPIDICRRLLKHSRKCSNAKAGKLRTHDWGYDWRLSPDLLAGRLITFLEGLECNQPHTPPEKRGAWMIAHSLGGLITRYVVNQRPELFAGVLYAGTPMNCVNILGPLRNGDNVLLSSKVLTAQVNFTIRTSFALLPEDGRCFIQKDTNERYDLDFFDPWTWHEWRLSPCINPAQTPPAILRQRERSKSLVSMMTQSVTSLPRPNLFGGNSDASREGSHTSRSIASSGSSSTKVPSSTARSAASSTAQYAEHLVADPLGEATVEPTMHSSSSKTSVATACTLDPDETVPTVYGARVASKEAIKYTTCFDDLAFAAGDGVVLASAAQLPEGYRVVRGGRIESDRGHVGLMGDLEGVGRALKALIEGRKRGIGAGSSENLKA
ncbi:uncharacterized protein AB675_8133 [Cyphellophora attinorum]|uniref:Uncharacterized protein n=1 Tax=Cyphellophora attinorum TaxID=1664694 RepID=A0A0N1H5Y5_9EURO|nr:uncharacterized protein AB675_8133 [Phialophora attinorum]KPI41322.1 hypothetical protein AB675_8133 [Phialophora attinorum]